MTSSTYRVTGVSRSETRSSCSVCGEWPACSYMDYDEKLSGGRICESCAHAFVRKGAKLVLGEEGATGAEWPARAVPAD